MSYLKIIDKVSSELPLQIKILEEQYNAINDPEERSRKMDDLRSYEQRMSDGLKVLKHLSNEQIHAIENIRNPSPELLANNKERYLWSIRRYQEAQGIVIDQERLDRLIAKLREIPLIHTT